MALKTTSNTATRHAGSNSKSDHSPFFLPDEYSMLANYNKAVGSMNPAVGIIRRVFPSYSNPSAP